MLRWLIVAAAYVAIWRLVDPAPPRAIDPLLLDVLDPDVARAVVIACATAAFALAGRLARQWVPDPWATRGALLAALSPYGVVLSASTAAPAAALLVAGTLLALSVREHPRRRTTLGGAACLAAAPWFGLLYAVPAAPVFAALVYWTYRRGRPMLAFLGLEVGGATAVALAGAEASERIGDPSFAPLDAAPTLALAALGAYLFARSRLERLSRAIPARRDAEVAVALAGLAGLGVLAVAGSVGAEAATPLAGALGAWGLQRFPRTGALLAVATLAVTAATL